MSKRKKEKRVKQWLLFDMSNLAYRALYSTGGLKSGDVPTGVLYGVLAEISRTIDRFQTPHCCFCFDHGKPKRLNVLPTYKEKRRTKRQEMTEEEKDARQQLRDQLEALRTEVLTDIGYHNVFYEDGYEADDVIASLVHTTKNPHQCIIVSSDSDLYQLLGPRCLIYNVFTHKVITEDSFTRKYRIGPSQWPDVKALAGCGTDEVPGISGVGEVTAVKYLTGKLTSGKLFDKIVHAGSWDKNLSLVRLPFEGCPVFHRCKDKVKSSDWNRVMGHYSFDSLVRR